MKLRVLDYYCHQGHQYEFFKTGHEFHLTGLNSVKPNWNKAHRPLNDNVLLIDERRAHELKYDVVIVRSPLNPQRYMPFVKNGAIPIAVGQTTSPYGVIPQVKHMVWNSLDVMNKYKGHYHRKMKHHYIVHGFDPKEFKPMKGVEKNGRVLCILNVFEKRARFLGWDLWNKVNDKTGSICDVLGHGNPGLKMSIGDADTFEDLVNYHSQYSLFFNPTTNSAMPRSRAEAMMSGCPIVSTNNFDIRRYIKHKKSGYLSNDPKELTKYIKLLLKNDDLRIEMSANGREAAIKHFHIRDFTSKWNNIFSLL